MIPEKVFAACRADDLPGFLAALAQDDKCYEKSLADGVTPTHIAAQHGSLRILQVILRVDANSTQLRDERGFSPLLRAAEFGHTGCVQAIARARESAVWDRDDYGLTALHRAARNGHLECCEWLVQHACELVFATEQLDKALLFGETPLFHACAGGHAQVCRLLLLPTGGGGANVNAVNVFRSTSLFNAVEATAEPFGDGVGVIKLLIEHGADVNWRNEAGQTPLCLAIDLRCWDAMQVLLSEGNADPDLPKQRSKEEEEEFKRRIPRFANQLDTISPLSLALLLNDRDLIAAFERGLGSARVEDRLCELSAELDPHELVGRHLRLFASQEQQQEEEEVFCVETYRRYKLFGDVMHVVRSISTGREYPVQLQQLRRRWGAQQRRNSDNGNNGNGGVRFHVVCDAAFAYPLLRADEQPQNILAS